MKIRPFTLAAFLITNSCGIPDTWAAPPENARPEYGPFFKGLTLPGYSEGWCCDKNDCGPVEARLKGAKWEVFIKSEQFGKTAPNTWVEVPPEAIINHPPKMVRPFEAITCWYYGVIRCFTPPVNGL